MLKWGKVTSFSLTKKEKANASQITPTIYKSGYEMQMVVQEVCKLHEPKINKLKGGSSATGNLIFHSWLKDIKVHIEDQNLTQKRPFSWLQTS